MTRTSHTIGNNNVNATKLFDSCLDALFHTFVLANIDRSEAHWYFEFCFNLFLDLLK